MRSAPSTCSTGKWSKKASTPKEHGDLHGTAAARHPHGNADAAKESRFFDHRNYLYRPGHWREHRDLRGGERNASEAAPLSSLRPVGRHSRNEVASHSGARRELSRLEAAQPFL